jgi:hypothetical protein
VNRQGIASWAGRRRLSFIIPVLVLAALASCSHPSKNTAPLPGRAPTVDVEMTEYHYAFSRSVPAGRVVIQAHDAGRLAHQITVFEMPADAPPLDVQLRGSQRRAAFDFASVTLMPGKTGRFAIELEPGRRYAFMCFLAAADGQSNALKGMNFEART